jgi:predicted nucleic acid-binding protein
MTVVADSGAVYALLDAKDQHHEAVVELFRSAPGSWLLPWAILPEVDYLATTRLGVRVAHAFVDDVAAGAFVVEWGHEADLDRARGLLRRYPKLGLGLVDAVVMATAERLEAAAIATLDVRHFGAVALRHRPRLLPRDREP